MRNTKIVHVIAALVDYGISITIHDPWVNPREVKYEYDLETTTVLPNQKFDAVVLGVAHTAFLDLDLPSLQCTNSLLYDVKGVLEVNVDGKL